VIIGRLIPARLDQSPEGRERLGVKEGERKEGRLTGFTQAPATFEEALAAIGGGEMVGVGAETAAAAAVASTEVSGDDGLLAAVSALTDATATTSESKETGDDDAARAAELLRASTSTAEEKVEPAPQFVDESGDGAKSDDGSAE